MVFTQPHNIQFSFQPSSVSPAKYPANVTVASQGHYQHRKWNQFPTLLRACQAMHRTQSDLVPSILKRCGQVAEGQEKGHKYDPKSGKAAMWGNAEGWFAQPGEMKA